MVFTDFSFYHAFSEQLNPCKSVSKILTFQLFYERPFFSLHEPELSNMREVERCARFSADNPGIVTRPYLERLARTNFPLKACRVPDDHTA